MGLFKHRHDIKILANVLDVDEMTTEIYLDLIPIDSVAEAQFLQWLDGQAKQVDSNIAWNLFMETNESIKQKYAYKLAKTIEKSTKMDKSSLTKLLNSFRRFFIGNTRERRSIRLPTDYNKLPEKSILRETLQQIRNVKSPKRRKMLLSSLIDHRRTDGRSLPPLDWTVLLNSELAYEDYSILFLLAIQQANVKLITKLLASGHVEGIGFNVIQQIGNENLQRLAEILSKSSQRHLIHIICQKCASIDWRPECESLCAAIQKLAMKNEEIVNELAQFIPNIETVQSFEHPFFRYFGTLSGLSMKSASILFRFWADIRKDMKMEEIVSRLLNIDRKLRDGCLIILMRFWSSKSVDECYELLSKMIPLVRISRNQETAIGDQQVLTFWEIFIVLVCSSPVMPVPLCSYADSDTETWTTIVGLFTDSFYEWIKYRSENIEFVNTIVLFICELRSISSLSNDIKEILNQCLRRCINQNSNVTEIIDNQNLWMDIF
uniref:Uncharacterized protein n=1 Tax=Acrobeloides nanus TaxID=290746 RepID=A0A914CS07_9BILA